MSKPLEAGVLVVGSGAAGLCAALEARAGGARVLLVSSSPVGLGNTTAITTGTFKAGLGGLSPEDHRRETLKAGRGLCDVGLVERLVQDAPRRITALKRLGVPLHIFQGGADLEGHHTEASPGRKVTLALKREAERAGVRFLKRVRVAQLLVREGRVTGVVIDARRSDLPPVIPARAVVLATGGYAGLFPRSTNPRQNVGAGQVIALRAGATLQDLEFVQFVPLGVVEPNLPNVLVPAEVLDHIPVVNRHGEQFLLEQINNWGLQRPSQMDRYARDRATRVVWNEIQEGRGDQDAVLMALADVQASAWNLPEMRHFHSHALRGFGLRGDLHVAPLPHFSIGGIRITPSCETGVDGLYAAGEVTGGLHGANRLGGNALTEAVVFGTIAGREAARFSHETANKPVEVGQPGQPQGDSAGKRNSADRPIDELRSRLQAAVGQHLGPARHEEGLQALLETISEINEGVQAASIQAEQDQEEALELEGMLQLCEMIARAALAREESRGSHFRLDHPTQSRRLGSVRVWCTAEGQVFLQKGSESSYADS